MNTEAIAALKVGQIDTYMAEADKAIDGENADDFWKELAAQHPQQLNVVDALNQWPDDRDYHLDGYLIPVLAILPALSEEDYRKLLTFLSHRGGSSYSVLSALAKHIGNAPALAIEFGAELEAGQEVTETLQIAWAESFATGASRVAAEYVIGYFQKHGRLSFAVKALLLGLPDSELSAHEEFVASGVAMVDAVMSPLGQDSFVWLTLVKLSLVVPHASETLMNAVNSGDLHATQALIGALTRLDASEWGVQKIALQSVLSSLFLASIKDKNAISRFEHVLAVLFAREQSKKPALSFLSTLGAMREDCTEILPGAFDAVFRDKDGFSVLLTGWLLLPGANFDAISHLIGFYHSHGGVVRLDDDLILAADVQRLVKLVRRILALTYYGPTLCAYAGEILRIDELGQTGLNFGIEMLNEIYMEFPGAAEDYLKQRVKEVHAKTPAGKIYRNFLQAIQKWREVLDGLPRLKELRASSMENTALNNVKYRVSRDIHKGAEKKSIFGSLFSKSTILQGASFAAYNRNGPPIVTKMIQSSHSMELPSSELADPLRGLLRRRSFLGDAE